MRTLPNPPPDSRRQASPVHAGSPPSRLPAVAASRCLRDAFHPRPFISLDRVSTQRPPRSVRLLSRLRSSRLLPLLLRVDLRRLILGMSLLAVLVTFLNTFHAGYSQQRELLIRNTLDANQAYASKMAELTDVFLQQALSQLSFSAHVLGSNFDDVSLQTAETRRLVHQNKTFNLSLIHI